MSEGAAPPEFSRKIDLREIGEKPLRLSATPAECAALARRFGIVAVLRLDAEVALEPEGQLVKASGRFTADIVQSCAVSAEDLPVHIAEPLTLRFVPARPSQRADEDVELAAEDCDEVEYAGTAFDLGEEVAQSMGVAIDPFRLGPMAEDARRKAGLMNVEDSGPFAALAALKKKLN
jgi:uncharacterized metal-binding protein YceD (DUF177 family)